MNWIDVREKLPENRTWVLCYDSHHANAIVLEYKHGCFFGDQQTRYYPTHWMPLPQKPKI